MTKCKICLSSQTNFFCNKNNYKYYLCKNCHHLFLNPQPTLKKLTEYYKNDFTYTAGVSNEKQIRKQSKKIIKQLIKLNPSGKILLDIGSGYGFFIDEATNKLNIKTTGIEPSKQLFKISQDNRIKNIKHLSFEDFYQKNKNKKYDFITLIHVIEHIRKPINILNKICRLLNNNGILYIETPNLKSHLFNIEKVSYTFLTPPDHLWLFSSQCFNTMIGKIKNVIIVKTSTYSFPEHFAGIVKRILNRESELTWLKRKFTLSEVEGGKPSQLKKDKKKSGKLSEKCLKYLLFDYLFSRLFYRLLNLGGYGSILQLYIKKKN